MLNFTDSTGFQIYLLIYFPNPVNEVITYMWNVENFVSNSAFCLVTHPNYYMRLCTYTDVFYYLYMKIYEFWQVLICSSYSYSIKGYSLNIMRTLNSMCFPLIILIATYFFQHVNRYNETLVSLFHVPVSMDSFMCDRAWLSISLNNGLFYSTLCILDSAISFHGLIVE